MVGTISFHHINGDAEVSYELSNQQITRTINKSALTKVRYHSKNKCMFVFTVCLCTFSVYANEITPLFSSCVI